MRDLFAVLAEKWPNQKPSKDPWLLKHGSPQRKELLAIIEKFKKRCGGTDDGIEMQVRWALTRQEDTFIEGGRAIIFLRTKFLGYETGFIDVSDLNIMPSHDKIKVREWNDRIRAEKKANKWAGLNIPGIIAQRAQEKKK